MPSRRPRRVGLATLVLSCASVASSSNLPRRLARQLNPFPAFWGLDTAQPISPSEYITIQLGLTQASPALIEPAVLAASDPFLPTYGKYLSRDAVLSWWGPTSSTTSTVQKWLASHNVSASSYTISPTKDWYTLNITVATANSLLGANFVAYFNDDEYGRLVRSENYTIPANVASALDVIEPTNMVLLPGTEYKRSVPLEHRASAERSSAKRRSRKTKRSSTYGGHPAPLPLAVRDTTYTPPGPGNYENCTQTGMITPDCVRKIYGVGNYTASVRPGNSVAVTGYLEEYARPSDFQLYLAAYNPTAAAANYSFSTVNVNNFPQYQPYSSSGEANLDTQIVGGVIYPIPLTFYSANGRGSFVPDRNNEIVSNEPYMDSINYFLSLPDSELPSVITTSYGDDEMSVSVEYAERACRGFAALGARGVTVVFSSADIGVGPDNTGGDQNYCITNDGTNRTRFDPNFPASCWAVTTVGETEGISPLMEATLGSGGGFSNYFSRPAYQQQAVNAYLKNWGDVYSSYFNRNGRAFPDITAAGTSIPAYDQGVFSPAGGTSAAAPMAASIFALLNDYRLAHGQPKLGFVNPLLYSSLAKGAFGDVTIGNNPGCGTNGFNATVGWDPVSGLGSLNFTALANIVIPK